MKHITTICFLFLLGIAAFIGCEKKAENNKNRIVGSTPAYADSAFSSVELFEFGMKEKNVTYDGLTIVRGEKSNRYLVKKTVSSFFAGGMKPDRTIKIEMTPFDSPGTQWIRIDKSCDYLNLDKYYYEVIIAGCCGAETELQYFDYDHSLIVEGTTEIIKAAIPNSKIKLYAGWTYALNLSYNSEDKYTIQVEIDSTLENYCGPMVPEIAFETHNPKDDYDPSRNEYELWSLNGIENSNQVEGVTVIAIPCVEGLDTLKIPIFKGKPFGKRDRKQTIKWPLKPKG